MMIIALGTVIEWFQNYYKNGVRIITRMVSDYHENGFGLLRERFWIITRTVSK